MKKIALLCLIYSFIFYGQITAQQVRNVQGTTGWRQLGSTVVNFTTDKDVIVITGNNWFRKLKFKVIDAPVQMLNMTVVYDSGLPENIPLNFIIPKGAESRLIDLNGGKRQIRKVEFVYKSSVAGFHGKSKLLLFGLK